MKKNLDISAYSGESCKRRKESPLRDWRTATPNAAIQNIMKDIKAAAAKAGEAK